MAAPTVRERVAVGGPSATTFNTGSGTQIGDLIIGIASGNHTSSGKTYTLQSGWTEITQNSALSGNAGHRTAAAWTVAAAAGVQTYTPYTVVGAGNQWFTGLVLTLGLFDTAAIVGANATLTSSANVDPPAVTLGVTRDWLVIVVAGIITSASQVSALTAPTNYANMTQYGSSTNGAVGYADRAMLAAASEDPGTFGDNLTPASSVGLTLGIPSAPTITMPPTIVSAPMEAVVL